MIINFAILLVGLVAVVKGADFLIDGSSALAKRLKIPEIVIGLTIVSFGTSAPEFIVSTFAGLAGKNELVLGNVIGSNIFNTFFILGISALIFPLKVQRISVRREIPFSLFVTLLLIALANDGMFFKDSPNRLTRIDGIIFLIFFGIFIYYTFFLSKSNSSPESSDIKVLSLWKTWIFIVIGFAGLFLGGKLMVDNAVIIAQKLHVSEKLIGLTIVAVGTSLPELATSAVAAFKKKYDLAVGNVVGSNIFNILFILGVSVQISPIQFDPAFNIDIYFVGFGAILLFIAMFTGKKRSLDRWEAAVFVVCYCLYTVYIIMRK